MLPYLLTCSLWAIVSPVTFGCSFELAFASVPGPADIDSKLIDIIAVNEVLVEDFGAPTQFESSKYIIELCFIFLPSKVQDFLSVRFT